MQIEAQRNRQEIQSRWLEASEGQQARNIC